VASHPLMFDPSMLLSRGNSSALSDSAMVSEPSSPKAGPVDGSPQLGDATSKDMGREASKDPLTTAGPDALESMGLAVAHPGQAGYGQVAPQHSVLQQHFDYFDM
jgi:hypothetical protein